VVGLTVQFGTSGLERCEVEKGSHRARMRNVRSDDASTRLVPDVGTGVRNEIETEYKKRKKTRRGQIASGPEEIGKNVYFPIL
jgi:hypothetical protein